MVEDGDQPTTADFQALDVPISAKIAAKRKFEQERRDRILNAKQRTIGIEVDKLEEAVVARKEREAKAKAEELHLENEMLSVDRQLKMLEVERKRMHEQATKDVVDFNKTYMDKADRREYYLSDPNALKTERLPTEDEIGVSSCMRYTGEDPNRRERIKAQQAQQNEWLDQQVYAKRVTEKLEKDADMVFAQSQAEILALRGQLEEEHSRIKNQVSRLSLDYNEQKRKEQEEERENLIPPCPRNKYGKPLEERIRDYREASFIATDPFINETTSQFNPNGTLRRDAFRGFDKQVYHEAAEMQKQQEAYKHVIEAEEKEINKAIDQSAEECRRALVLLEKKRLKDYTELVEHEMKQNVPGDLQSLKEKNKPARGAISDEFFKGYGQSMR